jgi:tyrosine-protein kinase Etk/Wzc
MDRPSSGPKSADERTLLEGLIHYISVILSYKWLIIIITVIAAALSGAFSIVSLLLPPEKSPLPNMYTATAVILLQREEGVNLEATLALLGLVVPGTTGAASAGFDIGQLAIRVMNSREFLDALIEDFDFYSKYHLNRAQKTKARQMLLSPSRFAYDRTTRTLTISYTNIEPVFARDMVARMVELLNEWFQTRGGSSKQKQKAFLEQKLREVSADVSRLEDQVKEFQETYGVLRVEDLAASQSQILENLRAQYRLKEIEIQNYMNFVKIEDPNMVMMKSERDNLMEQIKKIEGGFTNPSGTISPSKQGLPDLTQKFDNLNSALRIQKHIFEALSQQYELAKLSVESEPVFQVLEAAEVPDMKSGPSRGKICIIATILAFVGSAILALSLNASKSRTKEPGTLRRLAGRSK